MDVKNILLHDIAWQLGGDIYRSPTRYETKGLTNSMCKLKKTLYGLWQPPHAKYSKISNKLLEGFNLCSADHLFFVKIELGDMIVFTIYIDDTTLAWNSERMIREANVVVKRQFNMKDPGKLHHFLGLNNSI